MMFPHKIVLMSAAVLAMTLPAVAHQPHVRSHAVPSKQRHAAKNAMKVTLTPRGTKTLVGVQFLQRPTMQRMHMSLHNGKDCHDAGGSSSRDVALNPIGTGQISRTLVAIPFKAFSDGHYMVDVRDATSRAQAVEACARVGSR